MINEEPIISLGEFNRYVKIYYYFILYNFSFEFTLLNHTSISSHCPKKGSRRSLLDINRKGTQPFDERTF